MSSLASCAINVCNLVLVKPWTSRVKTKRRDDGTVPYGTIPDIADEINQAVKKLRRLLKRSNRFLAVHNSGAIVTKGPTQPQTPNKDIATSPEVDMYVRAAMEAETASAATAAWHPASPTNQLKWLQPSSKTLGTITIGKW